MERRDPRGEDVTYPGERCAICDVRCIPTYTDRGYVANADADDLGEAEGPPLRSRILTAEFCKYVCKYGDRDGGGKD